MERNNSADALRGIAALNVTIFHFIGAFYPSILHNNFPGLFPPQQNSSIYLDILSSPFVSLFYNGHFAVIIFFVLSGYVLTMPYFKSGEPDYIKLKKRLTGRYFRLNIPIIFAIFFSLFLYKSNLYFNNAAAQISSSEWFSGYLVNNMGFINALEDSLYKAIVFSYSDFVPPLWTVGIEFIGSIYILCYFILKPRKYSLIFTLSLLVLIFMLHKDAYTYYFLFFVGASINRFNLKKSYLNLFFILGIYFGAFQYNSIIYDFLPKLTFRGHEYFESNSFYNGIGAFFLVTAVVNGFSHNILNKRPLVFLGKISFALYLLHFIVLGSLSSYIYISFEQNTTLLILNLLIYLAICFILATIFERYIDRFAINFSHKFSNMLMKAIKKYHKESNTIEKLID